MGDIKSAREIAMEKLAKIEEATDEERLQWKYVPKGNELAVKYLRDDCNLVAELAGYSENERKYVVQGASEVLLRGISLPRNDADRRTNKHVMDGIKLIKSDKSAVENVYSRIRQIFNHYTEHGAQQRSQAFESLKAQFEAKMQQAVQQQMGNAAGVRIDVERHPQFHEEWRKMQLQLETPYLQNLEEYRHELQSIS
ncbi:MAG TPA: hypothetical protein G4O07_08740 [Dehalococcoidia bacterium]|nr:hypothetical protein [Dehalococcoidia bacterium]